jgi:hypothetical protein
MVAVALPIFVTVTVCGDELPLGKVSDVGLATKVA